MADEIYRHVIHALDEMHEELISHVTHVLINDIPPIGVPEHAADHEERHHQNMALTAERFHQIVQAGVSVDWSLVSFEFEWAGRKLTSMGATWENQETLIDAYFDQALRLRTWTDAERATLDQIAGHLRAVAHDAFNKAAVEN